MGQDVILCVNLVGQFTDIVYRSYSIYSSYSAYIFYLMNNPVDERGDAHDHRYLGTLFQMTTLISLNTQLCLSDFVSLQFQQLIILTVLFLPLTHPVEQPQEEY